MNGDKRGGIQIKVKSIGRNEIIEASTIIEEINNSIKT